MDCLLCLELEREPENGVQLCSPSWVEQNVQRIIETHLWPMTMFRTESQWLCSRCWHILQEFHKFYQRIERAHTDLNSRVVKSEYDQQSAKDLNLFEPEIVLEHPIAFIKQECKETEIDNGAMFKDEEANVPLMVIRPGDETPLEDPINNIDHNIEDTSIEKEKTINKRRKTDLETNSLVRPMKKLKPNNSDIEQSKVGSDLVASENPSDTSANSLFIESNDDCNSSLRYYYQSKMDSSEYDSFITQYLKLVCNKCQASVKTFEELQKHFIEAHKRKQAYVVCCGTKFRDRDVLVDHINVHLNPEYFKCEYCSKVLPFRKSFYNHLKVHDKMYACEICNKKFVSQYFVNKHKLTHATDEEKKYQCDSCEKRFASINLLTSHQKAVHLRKYSKLCDICGQHIPNSETYKRHMERHEGIVAPTISCKICGRLVANKHSLRAHMKSIHPEDGKQDHVCPVCQKVSVSRKALREHIRRTHKSGHKHKCNICERYYSRAENLKDHMATHTGTDLYSCPWCPKTFNSNGNMHNHRKKVHPKEWEEDRRKKYSGKLPPNFQPASTTTETVSNNLLMASGLY